MGRLLLPDQHTAPWFVRGVVSALTPPDETLDPVVHELLSAAVAAISGRELPERIERAEAAEVAEHIADPAVRLLLGDVVIALELTMHPLPRRVEDHVEEYLRTLGVRDQHIRIGRDTARNHMALLHADLIRQSWTTEETLAAVFHPARLVDLARSKLAYYGIGHDRRIADRWSGLASCPEGSWGRAVADFYDRHGFPYPGQPHGIYEVGAHHDWIHVLADYGTGPEGEIDVFAFIAVTSDDPHAFVNFAFTLALFQNGTISTVGGRRVAIARSDTLAEPGAPRRLADTLRRAVACPTDVLALDHFAWADVPLAEARERIGVLPAGIT